LPDAIERDADCLAALEAIRCAASVAMGLTPDLAAAARVASVPKVAMVAAPRETSTLSGRVLGRNDMSILIRMISVGQPHRAIPITGATCLAVAARVEGSIPHALAARREGPIAIAHPSGIVTVDARVDHADDPGRAHAAFGVVYRTARKLFEGYVFYRPRAAEGAALPRGAALPIAAE
jgi:2-methylaconitate isomerase